MKKKLVFIFLILIAFISILINIVLILKEYTVVADAEEEKENG